MDYGEQFAYFRWHCLKFAMGDWSCGKYAGVCWNWWKLGRDFR